MFDRVRWYTKVVRVGIVVVWEILTGKYDE